MTGKRLWQTIILNLQGKASARGRWLKKHKVFAGIGDNVRYQIRTIPLYPELIKIGNNVNVSSGVRFVTHDAMHLMYNKLPSTTEPIGEKVDCIEIKDNVFIGADCTILGNVSIGNNVIVSARSLINRDLEDNGIYGGVPARRIGDFDAFWRKRTGMEYVGIENNQHITEEEIEVAWSLFYRDR